ncbi:MAG: META domain-containing protein [Saccharospirillaceae bacterium]|nr:META domain-containing protein [Pseudomonadales bacterium]NRB79200.1 META domain-containing protein [Saccharospirillaceae bacterium]
MRLLIIVFLLSCSLFGCQTDGNHISDIQWQLSSYGFQADTKKTVLDGSSYRIFFAKDDNKVSGSIDCNSFQSTYVINNEKLEIEALAVTEIACPLMVNDDYLIQTEFIINALSTVATFSLSEGQLTLSAVDSSQLIFDEQQQY